jgi:hypothetical protein
MKPSLSHLLLLSGLWLVPVITFAQNWASRNLTDNGNTKNFNNYNYRSCGGLLFFAGGASTSTYSNEAWVSNGTFAGTFPLSSRNAGLPIAYSSPGSAIRYSSLRPIRQMAENSGSVISPRLRRLWSKTSALLPLPHHLIA